MYFRKINFRILQIFCVLLLSLSTVFLILNLIPAYQVALENILGKISLDRDFSSVDERLNYMGNYINHFLDDPIGLKGSVGSMSKEYSAINWYLTILGDLGLLGLLFTFIPLLTAIFISTNSSINKYGFGRFDKFSLILVPLSGLLFHGTFYASPLWLTIIVAYYI